GHSACLPFVRMLSPSFPRFQLRSTSLLTSWTCLWPPGPLSQCSTFASTSCSFQSLLWCPWMLWMSLRATASLPGSSSSSGPPTGEYSSPPVSGHSHSCSDTFDSSISSSMTSSTCLDTPNTSAPSPMIPILVLGSLSPSPLSSMLWGGLCATGGLSGKSPTLFSSC
ncbi:hypothetical protein EV363DRAFT_1365002, partial [Boletus edulis]